MSPQTKRSCSQCGVEPIDGKPAFKQCSRCKEVVYCSTDCQRLAWATHKKTCQLSKLIGLPKAATTLTPAKCGSCKRAANLVCDDCNNMAYCSLKCKLTDWPIHKVLCSSFKGFQDRPGSNFYRGIHFPVDGGGPHFVWLESEGPHFDRTVSEGTMKKLLGEDGPRGHSPAVLQFDEDERFARQFDHEIFIHYRGNFLFDGSEINRLLPNSSERNMLNPGVGDYSRMAASTGSSKKITALSRQPTRGACKASMTMSPLSSWTWTRLRSHLSSRTSST